MKGIKIEARNEAAIVKRLASVNGTAMAHTYYSYTQVYNLVQRAVERLEDLRLPRKNWTGAVYTAVSGAPVSNAYARKGFPRVATYVRLERMASGWFLSDVMRAEVHEKGGKEKLWLTPEQRDVIFDRLAQTFSIL